jgi:hypothetical protein
MIAIMVAARQEREFARDWGFQDQGRDSWLSILEKLRLPGINRGVAESRLQQTLAGFIAAL